MADQRQQFRFRLPWLAPQRPAQQTQRPRPTSETPRAPSQPTTAVPISRPVFRPAGIAPTQPPPSQPIPPPKTEAESSSPSPSRAATESPTETPSSTTAKPQSPSRPATESPKVTSQSASSPQAANVTVKPPSPSRAAAESPKVTQSTTTAKTQSPSRSPAESTKVTQSATTTKTQSPSRAAPESPKAISQSASSPPAATESFKPPSPPPAAAESSKHASQSISSPSGETATAKPPAPSNVAAETQVSSKSVSPPQTRTQISAASVPPSPSRGDSRSKASVVPPSPSRATSQAQPESRKSSQPQSPATQPARKTNLEASSPPSKGTQLKPTADTVSQSPSSPEKSQTETHAQMSAPQQEPKKEATSQSPLREPESKVEIKSQTTKITTSQDVPGAGEHKEVSGPVATARPIFQEAPEAPATPQKSNSSTNGRDQKPEAEEMKTSVQELPREEETNKATYDEPIQKTVSEYVDQTPSSVKDTKDVGGVAYQAPKRQQRRETSDRKETLATTSYIGKHIKTVNSSHPTEGNTTFQKLVLPTEEEAPRQKEIREDISKLVHKLTTGSQVDEKPVTVITLTGENRGASMHVSSEPAKKEASIHIRRGYKTNPHESPGTETTTDGEVRTRGESFGGQMKREAPSPKAYVNSNVQSVNNSIVFNASVMERSPGVQLSFSQPIAEAIMSNGKSEPLQTRKAEFIATPSEMLTHEPTVRRRCLRGLFMEPSDSDPDNPNKPRRHGCRYSCGDKNKDTETGFF
ncbi:hypothetical protein TorRG33x02_107130 [Trema orientale]|uniref:Proteoglycan 4-like n=1 Tax=Trema orientale TaxID=63057 RepID=A0A2P5F6N8_TREOI|nr:hypothetical protein TorRG33x02_107130 [Trema orientale]